MVPLNFIGIEIKEIIQASSEPIKQTFWEKILKWI